jgi:hypothetical protein
MSLSSLYYYILILILKNEKFDLKLNVSSTNSPLYFLKNPLYNYNEIHHLDIITNILNSENKNVTQKINYPPSKDLHDYCDLSPYFWPNPITEKPYIYYDGKKNPEVDSEKYDRVRFGNFYDDFVKLTNILYSEKHSDIHDVISNKCVSMLNTWFLYDETKMNPNMNFGQMVPGWYDGTSLGLIRLDYFVEIFDRCYLLRDFEKFNNIQGKLKEWIIQFLNWCKTSELAHAEFNRRNNHATWFIANICSLCYFVNNIEDIKYLISVAEKRIDEQILDDGSQPFEDLRGNKKNLQYAHFNIKAWLTISYIAKKLDIPFKEDKIIKAIEKYNYN